MCLLATSVGLLLYSLQHLPFHLTECAHTLTHSHRHTHSVARHTHTHTDTATNSKTGGCSHADTKKTGKMRDAYPSHTHPFSSLHPSHCCPLSHIICSFPLKTPWTYGPLKPAVSLSANTQTPTHSHQPFPIHGVGQQVYWILMISGPASP